MHFDHFVLEMVSMRKVTEGLVLDTQGAGKRVLHLKNEGRIIHRKAMSDVRKALYDLVGYIKSEMKYGGMDI